MSDGEDRSEAWRKLREEIRASPGAVAHARIGSLVRGFGILERNGSELLNLLMWLDSPESLHVWDYNHPERFEAAMNEVARQLHNFVASVRSLVDHTRRLMQVYPDGDAVRRDYEDRVRQDFGTGLPRFMGKLRDYTLHYRLPASSAQMSFGVGHPDDRLNVSIRLHRDDLLEWDGWNAEAKNYLREAPPELDFRSLTEEYLQLARGLYEWLVEALNDKHKDDFVATNELVAQEHTLLGRGPEGS